MLMEVLERNHRIHLKIRLLRRLKFPLQIPAAKLTKEAISFLRDWDIQIVAKTSTIMNVSQEGTLTLLITKKIDKKPFDGVLPAAFSFISADGGIQVSQ